MLRQLWDVGAFGACFKRGRKRRAVLFAGLPQFKQETKTKRILEFGRQS